MTYPRSLVYNERRTIRTSMYSSSLVQKRLPICKQAGVPPNKKGTFFSYNYIIKVDAMWLFVPKNLRWKAEERDGIYSTSLLD